MMKYRQVQLNNLGKAIRFYPVKKRLCPRAKQRPRSRVLVGAANVPNSLANGPCCISMFSDRRPHVGA